METRSVLKVCSLPQQRLGRRGLAWAACCRGAELVFALVLAVACGGSGGGNPSVLPPLGPTSPPSISSFTAAVGILTAGSGTTITPVFANATSASVEPGIGPVVSGTAYPVAPVGTTSYTLTLNGPGGTALRNLTISVVPPPHISSFTVSPAAVVAGGNSLLTAVFSGGSGTIDPGLGPVVSGTPVATGALAVTTSFLLTVTNPAGDSATATAVVTVGSGPAITSFTAARSILTVGAGTTLTAVFANASSASIDPGVGRIGSGLSYPVTPATTTTYTLTVNGLGGSVLQSVTVTVVPEPSISSFSSAPSTVVAGGSAQLTAYFSGGAGSIDPGIGPVNSGIPVATGPLTASTSYQLTVTNPAGDAVSASTTITVGANVGITGFAAAKSTLTAGSTTKITPTFVNATSASIDRGVGTAASGVSYNVTPVATTTYILTVEGLGGPVTRSLTITVVPAPSIASFTAVPAAVAVGGIAQLTASFTGGTGSVDRGIGSIANGLPVSTGALGASASYRLTVTNAAGDGVSASTTVTVGSAVGITRFSAARSTITAGSSTILTPVFVNAISASIDQGIGSVATGAGYTVTPSSTTTYRLTALGLGEPVTATVTVTVVPSASISSFMANPTAVATGGSSQLSAAFAGGTGIIDRGLGSVTSGVPVSTGALAASTTYQLTVTNPAGDGVTASTTVTVGSAVAITGFTAAKSTITIGSSTTITPVFVNAASAAIDSGLGVVSSGSPVTVSPATTTNYTLTAQGIGGPVTQSLTITVVPAAAIGSFAALPPSIVSGGSSQLTAIFSGGSASIDHGLGAVTSGIPASVSPGSTTTYQLTVTNAAGDSVTASATVTVDYTVAFIAGGNGTLTGSTSQTVAQGTSCTAVTALPNGGYALLNWSGTGGFATTAANPLIVANVTGNMTITANFAPLVTVTFNVAGATGSLTGSTSQVVASGGSCSGVTAVPIAGYGFLNWTGTGGFVTSSNNPLALANVTANMTITANFSRLPVIGSFYAASTTINAGQAAILNWTSVHYFTTASIDHGGGSFVTPNGMAAPYPAATTTYTLTATNAVGTATASVTVTVIQKPVITSFTASPPAITAGQTSSLSWSVTGLGVSYSLDQGVGPVAGNSYDVSPATTKTYTLTASNAAGSKTATTTVAVGALPPSALTYSSNPAVYTKGVAIAANNPSNSGGAITAYAVSPALPAGLSLNPGTGVISGTPSAITSLATYVVTGTNSAGNTPATLTLTVNDIAPSIGYSSGSYLFITGSPIAALVPTNTGGVVVAWSISPTLPTGLNFNSSNGTISGTPTAAALAQAYTVTASNTGGSITVAPVIAVNPPGPQITVQPFSQILAVGSRPSFKVTAAGTGTLGYQWFRNGLPVVSATAATYNAPVFSLAEDGAVYTVVVSDAFGGTTTSDSAQLSVRQDLSTWLGAHPTVAAAIRWQIQSGDPANYYIAPNDAQKLAWADWSPTQKADLNQAYLDAVAWFSAGAQPVAMVPGGTATTLTDQPTNIYSQVGIDTNSTMVNVTPAYFWRLYTAQVGFSLMLELSHQLPWSITGYNSESLRWLFDSATLAWLYPNGEFGMGTYPGANMPALRANNRPRTTFADPRWTYPWLKQARIIGGSRIATIGGFLDWMRLHLYHAVGGADTFGSDFAIWQYRGYSPMSRIVNGTIDSRYPGLGLQHFTEGCHGSTGLLNASLRVLNIPVQPIWVCQHELVHFLSEDLYMDHADDPYNSNVRNSTASSLLLLIDSATWRIRFGTDETVNIFGDSTHPAYPWIGYAAVHFP